MLAPELRSDPEIIRRVQAINVAYDVLSDPVQRSLYDAALKQEPIEPHEPLNPEIELRMILVRCAQTRQRFRMLLGRKRDRERFYRILGFEPLDQPVAQLNSAPRVILLPAPTPPAEPPKRRFNIFRSKKTVPPAENREPPRFPSAKNINEMFEESSDISFTDILFSGHSCPGCSSFHATEAHPNPSWIYCNRCHRIYCGGAVQETKLGRFVHCPWCGQTGRINRTVNPGDDEHMSLRGEIGRPGKSGNQPKLDEPKHKSLPE